MTDTKPTATCCECQSTVELCAIHNSDDTFAEHACHECGDALCDDCAGNVETLQYGAASDEDIQEVCFACYEKVMDKLSGKDKP